MATTFLANHTVPKSSSSASRKTSSKRAAMRDIEIRPVREEAFTVQPIDADHEPRTETFEEEVEEQYDFENDFSDGEGYGRTFQKDEVEEVKTEPEPQSIVKVKFGKFVQLVANHDFDEVVKNNPEEEIILSSDLLTELAGAHDEREGKKFPIIFLVGLAIGVVLTYILLNK